MTYPPSVAQALQGLHAQGLSSLTAQRLLLRALDQPLQARAWLLSHDHHVLPTHQWLAVQAMAARVAQGEPLAYVLGEAGFWDLTLRVTNAVLIPRPDTETLAEWALELCPGNLAMQVADLGTGSGALALTLAQQRPQAQVWAVERSPAAMAVAQFNANALGLTARWALGHWWDALPDTLRLDLVVSNPPYIAQGDSHLAALSAEPTTALVAGHDGLDDIRRIVAGATPRLRAGAWLLLEHGHDQAQAVATLLQAHGFTTVTTRHDMAGRPRCTGAQSPG
ncbi:MAG: peptide chain release factor N(5)-glutamine methyltransferase [Betaproteobacteria bacterium]|nr:peptide chain release factor N(5)-glutamine methyltransferase [Candidatus Fonsibacter lacus]